ncbi:MAG: hypothetical protein IJX64_04040 [Clostridia bacterium]|nr:hypothetical protein [Clostridia bacterium]
MRPWMNKGQMEALMREAPDKSVQLRYLAEINGVNTEEICRILGIECDPGFKLTPQLKKSGWTEEQLATVFRMRVRKCSRAKIAAAVGHSIGAVDRICATVANGYFAPLPRRKPDKKKTAHDGGTS